MNIIDGVDVSECTRYCADNGKCTAFKSQYLCSERNNCYTKRILKKNKTINILKEKLLRKEQECEQLKKQLMQKSEVDMFFNTPLEGWSSDPCGICPHKAENEELKEQLELNTANAVVIDMAQRLYKLKATLQDIKSLCYEQNLKADFFACEVLQKISEVQDE